MKEDITEVCEKLDNLLLQTLDLMEEKVVTTIQLENHLRDGHLELAKARYIQGKETVGMLRVPQDTAITSLFNLETSYPEHSDDETEPSTSPIPRFSINLKDREEIKEIQDPLKWFGVLVPQSLKTAQKRFQESLYLSARISDIGAELNVISKDFEAVKKVKGQLLERDNRE
ncbi:coiled-coil domain-containing protein 115 [Diachasma alloeum]|uniref:coiled-coil domain-containing protein 115 n=1 Tax=Diachasma alloeum TaxID=454923 RepID=UPI00073839B4|nr:coiled-coil domain-containing protein 115 [Diachasma alloeum]